MLYGEGEKAFIRLQEEIARKSDDQTLFSWTSRTQKETSRTFSSYRGLFGTSPAEFTGLSNLDTLQTDEFLLPFSTTSIGFNARFPLLPVALINDNSISSPPIDVADPASEFLAILNVVDVFYGYRRIAILVKRLLPKGHHFVRVRPDVIFTIQEAQLKDSLIKPLLKPVDLYVQQELHIPLNHVSKRLGGFLFGRSSHLFDESLEVWSPYYIWSPEKRTIHCPFKPTKNRGIVGALKSHNSWRPFTVIFGISPETSAPAFCILDGVPNNPANEDFTYIGDGEYLKWKTGTGGAEIQKCFFGSIKITQIRLTWRYAVVDETFVCHVDVNFGGHMSQIRKANG
jgi:hypothetical protein